MDAEKKQKRARRAFTDEFKAEAVRLVLDEGKSVAGVARDLDLTTSALRVWVERARADRTKGKTGLTSEERAELSRLRKENRTLKMERDILKKAAVGSGGQRNSVLRATADGTTRSARTISATEEGTVAAMASRRVAQ